MADIFISYSTRNARIVAALARDLMEAGFTVWYDTSLIAGERFSDAIAREIDQAGAVIVIWSPEAAQSDWVRWEANRARERGALVQVMTPNMTVDEIPAPFGVFQTELISNREGIFAGLANLGIRRSDASSRKAAELKNHLVILVHGIRTRASWMGTIAPVLERAGFAVGLTSFGRFGALRFLAPFGLFRSDPLSRVVEDINTSLMLYKRKEGKPPEKMSVISHSFGTYVISEILMKHPEFKWHRIIFAGSVVREDYKFSKVVELFDDPLINEVGTRDFWPALAESAGWGYGSVGAFQWNRPGTVTRFHKNYRHSDFLTPLFCEKYWVPFLRGEAPRAADNPTRMPLWVRVLAALPLRWLILLTFLAIPAAITLNYFNPDLLTDAWPTFTPGDSVPAKRYRAACFQFPALCRLPDSARRDLLDTLEKDAEQTSSLSGTGKVDCFKGLGNCESTADQRLRCSQGQGGC
ncbi:TIR domain-containing protein [Bradyrhizobium guangdongense]|uniref:TIR domain-containing protein n=1 Tax=Bradyrhizobium guangdongense TaxID=1325090 RepID=A0ABX6UQR9_9BRAD|nr:TIR domain-containing protein [Bradyrhizobium guangdongense]QAU42217.1 hypothetical protein X265_34460 [Bradyrhizobium guangdongense]QOZ63276.1 hypothetical protein XH86_34500 [Bradyrhizobium guangdongense]